MKTASRIWRITGFISAISTLLLLFGFLYAVFDIGYPAYSAGEQTSTKPTKEESTKAGTWDVTAIGDSLAKGTGDDTGAGFARRSVDLLNKQGISSKLVNNLGINGLTTKELLPMLKEQGVSYALKQAGIIVLSIGGNDLFNGTQQLQTGTKEPSEAEIQASITDASPNFEKIIAEIKEINPQAKLVYVSLYNPFSDLKEMRGIGDNAVARWNEMAQKTLNRYEGTLVVPTYDLFTYNYARYLASDHFHPNGEGYQAIAERMVQSMAHQ